MWALVGDHDYKRDCLLMPNVSSNKPCGLCPADTVEAPWFDCRQGAAWVSRVYKQGQFDVSRCVLFGIMGVSNLTNYPDWMHDKPLGTDKVCYLRPCLLCISFVYMPVCTYDVFCMLLLWYKHISVGVGGQRRFFLAA